MESSDKRKRRWSWQISLRTLLLVITMAGGLLAYGSHFRRLTLQAQAHRDEAQRRLDWGFQMLTVSFHMPQQYWIANGADREWHTAKEQECLQARWFPWREVDESNIPPLAAKEEGWPDWTTEWRSAQK